MRGRRAPLTGSAPIFAALGDETRLQIVTRIAARGPMSIVRLTAGTGMTRQGVTKHLHVLSNASLVRGRRMGRERIWDLERERLRAAGRSLERISVQWMGLSVG
ncbi:MAG TPA: metalloregulator ArsR/SmtB family transcription factor [Thermoanaerobaculia bacterium]